MQPASQKPVGELIPIGISQGYMYWPEQFIQHGQLTRRHHFQGIQNFGPYPHVPWSHHQAPQCS